MRADGAWIHAQNRQRVADAEDGGQGIVLCTSGLSYLVLHASGQVTRCFHDLKPLGTPADFLAGRAVPDGPRPCSVGKICDPSGDQMFSSIWEGFSFAEAPMVKWRESTNPDEAFCDGMYTVVFVTDRCNFSCPYCCNFYPTDSRQPRPSKAQLDVAAWDAWVAFLRRYSVVQLNVNGGEPLMWPWLPEKLAELSDAPAFEIGLNTNLSVRSAVKRLPSSPALRAWRVSSSIHPAAPQFSFDAYMENALELQSRGWWVRAHVLTWPGAIDWWDEHAARVRAAGIDLWLKPVGGYDLGTDFWREVAKRNGGAWKTAEYLNSIDWVDKPPPRDHRPGSLSGLAVEQL